jgi:hypothetical protein
MTFRLACLLILYAACTSEPTTFGEPRTYRRLAGNFTTEAECVAYQQQQPIFNCWQTLDLCPDGDAFLIVTDIVNVGTYEVGDAVISTTFESGDVPELVDFAIDVDGNLVAEDLGTRTWERDLAAQSYCTL